MTNTINKVEFMKIVSAAFDVEQKTGYIDIYYNYHGSDIYEERFIAISGYDTRIDKVIFSHNIGNLDSNITIDQALSILKAFVQ